MIFPIVDEITLDPIEYKMTPYQDLLNFAVRDYCRKAHIKLPPSITMKNKESNPEEEKKPVTKKVVVSRAMKLAQAADRVK